MASSTPPRNFADICSAMLDKADEDFAAKRYQAACRKCFFLTQNPHTPYDVEIYAHDLLACLHPHYFTAQDYRQKALDLCDRWDQVEGQGDPELHEDIESIRQSLKQKMAEREERENRRLDVEGPYRDDAMLAAEAEKEAEEALVEKGASAGQSGSTVTKETPDDSSTDKTEGTAVIKDPI